MLQSRVGRCWPPRLPACQEHSSPDVHWHETVHDAPSSDLSWEASSWEGKSVGRTLEETPSSDRAGAQLHRAHLDLIHGRAQSCSVEETAVAALQRSAALLGVRRLNAPLAGHGGMREDDAAAASSDPASASSARRHNFPPGLWGASLDPNHANAQILGHALPTPISARASALPPAATMTWRNGAGRRGTESSAPVSGHTPARQAASAPSEHGGRG